MTNPEIRDIITSAAEDWDVESVMIDGFDNSIMGMADDGRLIYDYGKMVEELSNDDHIDPVDAIEYIEYNVFRSLPYQGKNAPIIITSIEDLRNRYGTMNDYGKETEDGKTENSEQRNG